MLPTHSILVEKRSQRAVAIGASRPGAKSTLNRAAYLFARWPRATTVIDEEKKKRFNSALFLLPNVAERNADASLLSDGLIFRKVQISSVVSLSNWHPRSVSTDAELRKTAKIDRTPVSCESLLWATRQLRPPPFSLKTLGFSALLSFIFGASPKRRFPPPLPTTTLVVKLVVVAICRFSATWKSWRRAATQQQNEFQL